jgi:hypothetical protein
MRLIRRMLYTAMAALLFFAMLPFIWLIVGPYILLFGTALVVGFIIGKLYRYVLRR